MLSISFDELSETHQAAWEIYNENLDSAEILFKEALSEYKSYLDVRRETVVLIDLASLNNQRGNLIDKLRYLHQAERLSVQFEDSTIKRSLYKQLYGSYAYLDRLDKALEYLKKQSGYIQAGNDAARFDYLNNISDLYIQTGDFNLAKEYLDTLNFITPFSDINKRFVLNKYGLYFYKRNKIDSALHYYKKSMDYYSTWHEKVELSATLNYYSIRQETYGDVALYTIDSLLAVAKNLKYMDDFAQLLSIKSDITKDTTYIHEAIQIADTLGTIGFKCDLINAFVKLQNELHHFEYSESNKNLYNHLKDSIESYNTKLKAKHVAVLEEAIQEVEDQNIFRENFLLYLLIFISLALILYSFYYKNKNRTG